MKKRGLIAVIISAAALCGCAGEKTLPDVPKAISFSSSEKPAAKESPAKENPKTETEPPVPETPAEKPSSCAEDWDYQTRGLKYDFKSGNTLKALEELYGKTGEELGYTTPWCTYILSRLLNEAGYEFEEAPTPCDLAVELLNNNYAKFYCFRERNYNRLFKEGLKNRRDISLLSRSNFTPRRGDIVIFLWTESIPDEVNWSHIGIVAKDYDGKGFLYTLEGNAGDENNDPEDDAQRSVRAKKRPYDETVIGVLRLTK